MLQGWPAIERFSITEVKVPMEDKEPIETQRTRFSALERAKASLGTEYSNYWIFTEMDGILHWSGTSHYFGLGAAHVFVDNFNQNGEPLPPGEQD